MRAVVIANWKMHPATHKEAKRLLEATKKIADFTKNASIVVAPPSLYVRELVAQYKGKRLAFAVQNAHPEPVGAHTGEISFAQAKDAKVSHVIVGHSERRAAGESNEDTRKKMAAALSSKLIPVLCVGELTRGSDGEHFAFVREQVKRGLADVPSTKIGSLYIAYEPVWAIGGEKAISSRDVQEMSIFIRKVAYELYGEKGMSLRILYGGSVNESNAKELLEEGGVGGFVVGHVSVDADRFAALIASL